MCLFIVEMIILRGPLDYLPLYNVNVRVLERLLPIIAIVIQGGSALSCEFQNVHRFTPLLPDRDNSYFYQTTKKPDM